MAPDDRTDEDGQREAGEAGDERHSTLAVVDEGGPGVDERPPGGLEEFGSDREKDEQDGEVTPMGDDRSASQRSLLDPSDQANWAVRCSISRDTRTVPKIAPRKGGSRMKAPVSWPASCSRPG